MMVLKTLSALGTVAAASLLLATTAEARDAVVVSPNHMHDWFFFNDNNNGPGTGHMVEGPGDPPLGSGSAELGVVNTGDRQALGTQAYNETMLGDITHLSYWTHQTDPSHAMPLQHNIRYHPADTGWQGRLVFEPGNGNPGIVSGAWQQWTPMGGRWWASQTGATGSNGLCPQSRPCTWNQVKSNWPQASVNGTLLFKAGGGWGLWVGNVDALTIGVHDHATRTYDFEPAAMTKAMAKMATAGTERAL
ncbi:MAG TPA: hypothetical protein VIO37_00445 [Candidatus Dormibacteraeota bacterium]